MSITELLNEDILLQLDEKQKNAPCISLATKKLTDMTASWWSG